MSRRFLRRSNAKDPNNAKEPPEPLFKGAIVPLTTQGHHPYPYSSLSSIEKSSKRILTQCQPPNRDVHKHARTNETKNLSRAKNPRRLFGCRRLARSFCTKRNVRTSLEHDECLAGNAKIFSRKFFFSPYLYQGSQLLSNFLCVSATFFSEKLRMACTTTTPMMTSQRIFFHRTPVY